MTGLTLRNRIGGNLSEQLKFLLGSEANWMGKYYVSLLGHDESQMQNVEYIYHDRYSWSGTRQAH